MDTTPIPDVVGAYAARIREHLAADPSKALTVAELCEALKLSDRLVRMGVDRLVFTKEVAVSYRHMEHRRGTMPRQYQIPSGTQS